jgi:hypothetical protein
MLFRVVRNERDSESDGTREPEGCTRNRTPGLQIHEILDGRKTDIGLNGDIFHGHLATIENVPDDAAQVGDPVVEVIFRPKSRNRIIADQAQGCSSLHVTYSLNRTDYTSMCIIYKNRLVSIVRPSHSET